MVSGSHRRWLRGAWPVVAAILLLTFVAGCHPVSDVDKARSLQEAGDFEASLEPLRHGLEAHPDDPELHYLNGVALVRTGRGTQASWSLHKAMEDPEWLGRAGLLLASAALAAGNHEMALEATERILQADPDAPEALLMRAHARIASRTDYEGALADSDRLLELDPENGGALATRAVALLGLKRVEEAGAAIEVLQQHQAEDSLDAATSARLCAAGAIFAKEKGEPEVAAERFASCLDAFPTQPFVISAALEFYDATGDAERPIELLRAALEEEPRVLPFRSALAARLRLAGRADEAEQLLLEATGFDDARPEAAWTELAQHYLELEDYASMASALERAVAAMEDPPPDLEFSLADALVLAKRYDEALELARRLSVPAHRSLIEGRVHFEQGRPREALEHLSEGLRLWPDNAGARYYAARAAERIGDIDRAIEEYRYAIRADPAATDARYRLALLHEAEGRYRLAVEAATSGRPGIPFDSEAGLVALRAAARGGLDEAVRKTVAALGSRPALGPRIAVAIAEGVRDRAGDEAAVSLLLKSPALDHPGPRGAALLRALVVYAAAAGESERAAAPVEAALAAHPDVADFQQIYGLLLEQRGAPPAEIRAAYTRALELDPQHVPALLSLARLEAASGDAEAALALQARAADADPYDAEPLRARAALLLALDRPGEAATALEKLLDEHPYDGEAAATLARLRRDRGEIDGRTLELERRAQRFVAHSGAPHGEPAGAHEGDATPPSAHSS